MTCRLVVCLAFMIVASLAQAADPIAWLPSDLNAVARVKVAEIYNTPLAKKEGWIKQASESFIQQQAFIPPGTSQIVIGAQLDLSDSLSSNRKYTILVPESQLTLEKLSPWLPSGLQKISGKSAAQFGDDGYVVDSADGCWLATTHASRQSIAHWVAIGAATGGNRLSPYLNAALSGKSKGAQILLAIDLQENFDKNELKESLNGADWLPAMSPVDAIADVLSSAMGITFAIQIDEERTGSIVVEFNKDAKVLRTILDKLVEAVLQRLGATSDHFEDWKWSVEGNRVLGAGPVSPNGGRRLLSIMDPPSITHVIQSSTESTPENKMAKTSQKYCKSVRILLDDLQKNLKKTNDNHALWFERYGRKIDDLPKLHVDGELLDYSAKVSNSLRYQAQAQRMSNVRAGTRIQESGSYYSSYSGYVSPYGGSFWVKSIDEQGANTIKAQENLSAKSVRFSEWKQIEDGMVDIRRKMTDKYQLEF